VADTNGLMVALTQLTDQPPAQRGPRCSVGAILATLDEGTAQKLRDLLNTRTVSATQIADALTANGHRVQAPAVARHRRRGASNGCRCTT
jgi:predicted component of type VI protein secretion system